MELRHLRYFVAVAEELSFTRAAAKLRLAQPSLTRQIQNLEEELGVQLLERGKKGVTLSEEGRSFLIDAERLVAMSIESIEAVRRVNRGEESTLNVGYHFKFNFAALPATLTTFYRECPKVAVNLFDQTPGQQLKSLAEGSLDLGFVGLLAPPDGAARGDGLEWECVAQHDVVVVLPENHPLAVNRQIALKDLRTIFFVAMSEETHPGSRDWLTGICGEAGFRPRVIQDVELESGIMTFVAEGLGVTLARAQISKLPHVGVVFRPLANPAKADYWLAWRAGNRSKALARFTEIVKKLAPKWP